MQHINQKYTELRTVDSTNNYVAKAIDSGNYESGTAILAHFQENGKGQRGSSWQSKPGENLTFSFAIPTDFLPLRSHFLIAKAVSIALWETANEYLQLDAHIKWPNDLLVNGRKLAGMLIESKIKGHRYTVIGIGLNINQMEFGSELKATSMMLELGRPLDLPKVLHTLLSKVDDWLTCLHNGDFALINQLYSQKLYGYRRWVSLELAGQTFKGMITDVDDQGMLLVHSSQGKATQYAPKEIKINY